MSMDRSYYGQHVVVCHHSSHYCAFADYASAQVVSPTFSSTNSPKAAPQSTLGKPLCPNTLDIVIAIDSSESVQAVWNNIIDDAQGFIRNFQVADHLTRIGIVDFSAVANVYSPLDSNNTVEGANRVLEKLRSRPQNGETWVELGLDRASEVFDTATPPRPNARKVLVMYTDGETTSRDYNSLKDLVKHQREQEIETFVITVTNTSYQPGLQIMASSFAHIYHMGKQVQIGQPTISEGVCWDGFPSLSANKAPKSNPGVKLPAGPSLNFVDPSQTQNISPEKSKCEREKEGAMLVIESKVPTLVPIFVPECEKNGKYKIVQRHEGTGYYWCVDPNSGEIINGTKTVNEIPDCPSDVSQPANFTSPIAAIEYDNFKNNTKQRAPTLPPQTTAFKNFSEARKEGQPIIKYIPPVILSKCQEEAVTAKEILQKKTPSSVPVLVPECEENGDYQKIQTDGSKFFWCVDPKYGEIINGTRTYNEQPHCLDNNAVPTRALTMCEQEKEDNTRKQATIPDIYIPECSVFDGLFLEIQRVWIGSKFCVNRVTGDHIKGTDVEIGKPDPVCPDMSKCEKMQVEIHTHNYRNLTRPAILRRDVPICKRNGFFDEVQSSYAINKYWCVNKITGTYIDGTITYDVKPECPGASNNAMSSYISSLAEGSQPGFLSSSYNITQPANTTGSGYTMLPANVTKELDMKPAQAPVPTVAGRVPQVVRISSAAGRPMTNCQRQQIEKMKLVNVSMHILQCSEYDGLYVEIQTSPHTGRKYCVTRYTGDYIKGTEVPPGPVNPKCPVKSKCEHEREKIHTYNYRNFGLPNYKIRTILHCNQNGFYKLLQTDNKTRVNWCVDELTGEYISPSVMHFPRVPDCSKISPPHTRCEHEKAEMGRRQLVIPETFVPRCNVYNGLYADIQYMPSGWKWCVDKFTGERIGSTDTEPGPQEPLCPELSNCEKEKVEAHTYNYRNYSNSNFKNRIVPQCDPNGLYATVQTNKNLSMWWCADKVTGRPLNGTTKYSWQGKPICPDAIPPVCLLPKVPGPCKASEPRTFFNVETATCEAFVYGGCDGNANNFNSLQECEEKCGMVSKCFIQKDRATKKQDKYIPSCMVDGSFQQFQHNPNGSSWCVDTETGFIIPGTYMATGNTDCSRVPVIIEPKREPTCTDDNDRIFGTRPSPLIGVYIPQCTADGFYEDIQRYSTTGEMWCVHKYTGIQIEGTLMKIGAKVAGCPKHPNVDCLLPREPGGCKGLFPRFYYDWQKNRCIRFNYGGCQGNANNFKNFRLCERSCKDPFKTNRPLGLEYAAEQAEPSRERTIVEANPLTGRVPIKENDAAGSAPKNTSAAAVEDKTPAVSNATVTAAQTNASVAAPAAPATAAPATAAAAPEKAAPAAPEKAALAASEKAAPAASEKAAPAPAPAPAPVAPAPAVTNASASEDVSDAKAAPAVPEKVAPASPEKAAPAPVAPASAVANASAPASPAPGTASAASKPADETAGAGNASAVISEAISSLFGTQQNRTVTTAQAPIVTPIVVNTTTAAQGSPAFGGSPVVPVSNGIPLKDLLSGKVEAVNPVKAFFSNQPESLLNKHEETPVNPDLYSSALNGDGGVYLPKFDCETERDFANSERIKYNIIGAFIPSCEENGVAYKALQYNASSGERWCVDPVTGHEILLTRKKKGEPIPDCTNLSSLPSMMVVVYHKNDSGNSSTPKVWYSSPTTEVVKDSNKTSLLAYVNGTLVNGTEETNRTLPLGVPAIMHFPRPADLPTANQTDEKRKKPNKWLTPPDNNFTDIFHPNHSCAIEYDFSKARNNYYQHDETFMPKCDERGNYEPLQSFDGNKWCVDIITGHEIVGTRVGVSGPDPYCPNDVNANAAILPSSLGAGVEGDTLQRNAIVNGTAPNVLSEKETSPQASQASDANAKASISALQNLVPIENVIAPINVSVSSNDTVLNRNSIINATTGDTIMEAEPPAPKQNDSAVLTTNATHVANLTKQTKEGMQDLGEAIGSLFGGLIGAMMPMLNATSNSSNLLSGGIGGGSALNETDLNLKETPDSKERSELNEFTSSCPYEIGVNLTKLGCVNDDQQIPRPLPVLILNDTHINTGVPTEQDDWKSFLRALVCKCAIEVRKKGWYTFGIQNYGECYSGPDEGRYNEDGEASQDMCINEKQEPCSSTSDSQACAGISKKDDVSNKTKHANYVFMIVTETHKQINIIHYDKRKRKRSISGHLHSNFHKRRHGRHNHY